MSTPIRRRGFRVPLWLAATMAVVLPTAACASEYHGRVHYGAVPVPGATVTLTQGDQQISTLTDSLGIYEFANVPDGTWKISISLKGFTPVDGTVAVTANVPQGDFALEMLALPQLLAMAQPGVTPEPKPLQPRVPEKKEAAKAAPKSATGNEPQTPQPPAPSEDTERAADALLINGSESNAATSQYSMSPAIGNRRPGTKALYNGSVGAFAQNSIFNAKPYSLTGLELPKDSYNRITMVATFGGPIRIPPIFYHGPNFFVAYQWTRNGDASTGTGLVPTPAERNGDLSSITNAQGQPVPIYNPATGAPFVGALPVSPQAAALLALYPLPNVAGSTSYNYETPLLNETHQDALQSRLDKTVGHRDSLYGGFAFQSIRANTENLFGFVDSTDTLGLDTNVNWQHRFARQLFVTLTYHLTRQRTLLVPEFANRTNVSGNAGISGNDQQAREWGPPTLSFAGGVSSLSDANSEFNRNRTDLSSVKATTTRGRHTLQAGGDFRRQEYNQLQQSNPRGSFTFTGAATSGTGTASTTSGSSLADFLIGTPDTSQIAFGNADKYLRQSSYDLYVNDDWRVRPELTLNVGMRWEYGAPITELKGRLVNLDIAPDFSAAAPVLASAPKGSITGTSYPTSLVQPDKHGFEPRVALAWRPIPASTLVVRAGYGISDDTSVYLGAAQSMSQQAPLSTSLSVQRSAACPLTLADGFQSCAGTTADTYAVDPNLRVGYVQNWQVSAQRDMPWALVVTATYLGTKGTHGTQEFLPNTYPIGTTNPCPQCPIGFTYRTSGGNQERNAAQLQVRRRLRAGLTATLLYTYAKSVDDDAQVGGAGHSIAASATAVASTSASSSSAAILAQNWLNLRAERSLSSFDQRHLLNLTLQYTTGMGKGGGTLMSGWRGRVLKEWTVLEQIVAGSGLPETPVYLAAVPGTGVTGSIRPNRTSAPIYAASNGYFLNAAAYATPTSGAWGTAGRNSITGPGTFTMNTALQRTVRMPSNTSLDIRFEADNVLNHPTFTSWNTITNSSTFGLPASTNAMRVLLVSGRWRF